MFTRRSLLIGGGLILASSASKALTPTQRLIVLGGPIYSQQAQAIFAAFTTPPTDARKALINGLVNALIASGAWGALDVLYVMAAANSQAATINWKNPGTFTAVPTSSPTFTTDRGFAGDGAASYVTTGWNPATNGVNYMQDASSFGVMQVSGTRGALAGNDSGQTYIGTASGASAGRAEINSLSPGSPTWGASLPSYLMVVRTSSASQTNYDRGANLGTSATTSKSIASQNIQAGKANGAFSAGLCGALWAGGILNDTQAMALYNALHTYMIGVGADT